VRKQAQIIRWAEPPPAQPHGGIPPGTSTSRWRHIAAELRESPGRSAVIYEGTAHACRDLAWRINRGIAVCFAPAGAFYATTRRENETTAVYARYAGHGDA
jgi:hypothetical protein